MAAQLSYGLAQGVAYAGSIYAIHPHEIVSRSVETVAGADFGLAVSRGTDKDNQVVIGSTDFVGITVRSLEREGAANTGQVKYSEKETAGVIRDGYIWAVCPTGCVPGDAVNYVNATGILDSGAAVVGETLLNDAYWDTTAAAGQLGVIRISGTNTTAGS